MAKKIEILEALFEDGWEDVSRYETLACTTAARLTLSCFFRVSG